MSDGKAPPDRPDTFGTELRRLREISGLTLDDIVAETKISRRILESLEGGSFQYLPERIFCRNFVRQYAGIIGVEETKLVTWFEAAWEHFLIASGSHPNLVEPETAIPGYTFRWRYWLPIALGVVVVGVIAVLVIRGSWSSDDVLPTLQRSPSAVPVPTLHPTWMPSPTAPLPDDVGQPRIEGAVNLKIQALDDQECWVHYRDGDGRTGQQLLSAEQQLDLDLHGPVLLTLGNAGAAVLRVGGTEYADLGLPGQVLHMEISSSGLQFLGAGAAND